MPGADSVVLEIGIHVENDVFGVAQPGRLFGWSVFGADFDFYKANK